ncbi:MAG: hypothetical protein IPP35_12460 [Elusimicrobia bacterium]|nr:hypothetical protein [Elusimicrobiota bacterium]
MAEAGLWSFHGAGEPPALAPHGAVLAFASAPGYDPSQNLGKITWGSGPAILIARSRASIRPARSFKIGTAAAVLKDTTWNTRQSILCTRSWADLGNKKFGCWKRHGVLDFSGPVSSCNVYFYNLGRTAGPDLH